MQFLRTSRAAHAADTDWGMVAFRAIVNLAGAWFAVAAATYFFMGYEGLTIVVRPFTTLGEWAAGMYLAYPGLLNAIVFSAIGLIAAAMLATAIRHELPRMRAERKHQAQSTARSRQIDNQVSDAANTLRETEDVVHYITSLPFSQ